MLCLEGGGRYLEAAAVGSSSGPLDGCYGSFVGFDAQLDCCMTAHLPSTARAPGAIVAVTLLLCTVE